MTRGERFALGSIAFGCLVLGLKGVAWWMTGSAALYSDALESTVNVAASAVAMVALRLAAAPADADHPYGHSKAEIFAAAIEGAMIVGAALSIFAHAWEVWHDPHPLDWPWSGLAVNGVATAINLAWSIVLGRVGRHLRSPALVADGKHLFSDVVTSVGIAAGVALAIATGNWALDPLIAGATGLYVLWSGVHIVSGSVGGLMDAAPEPEVLERIRILVSESATGAIEAHDLRTRVAGRLTFLDFHLVVPATMTVAESHDICDRIEARLQEEMDHLVVTIHVEPDHKAKQQGVRIV